MKVVANQVKKAETQSESEEDKAIFSKFKKDNNDKYYLDDNGKPYQLKNKGGLPSWLKKQIKDGTYKEVIETP